MVFDAVFFLKCWCKSILCDSNVVATFTWLQLFLLISDVFFIIFSVIHRMWKKSTNVNYV